ncbi:hypothetical protein [Methyloversatilis discipulorum]|jgi:hypothetical protein|uniref:hypothetical protein n=1 Tax=Methyloversatilis discipulorum TaxID=1119528 RepID=UPI00035FCD00|nr:hypothetical protein [Methyloversatilis discipulorum]
MTPLGTDRYILQCIFNMYLRDYPGPREPGGRGANDPYIAIDIHALAHRMKCSPELLFGRLYYHLDQKHRYKRESGAVVSLFTLQAGEKRHAVNFPFLAAILAEKNQEFRRHVLALAISFLALGVSTASLLLSFAKG